MKRALACAAVALAACGNAALDQPACNVSYACAPGQTCATADGRTFACVPSGSSKAGDRCDSSVGAAVTCGDGLTCLGAGDPKHGACTGFCDAAHPCPTGKTCESLVTTMGSTLLLCL